VSVQTPAKVSLRIGLRSDLISFVAVIVLPAACIWLTRTMVTDAGYVDPFFYTGYMINSKSLISHFGMTYYLVRMAVILPGMWIYGLFGAEHGFFVLEYLKLLTGSLSIFAIARRFYGPRVALFSAVFLCFSPWFIRANTWDYVDGFAIDYILAGIAFVLVPRRLSPISFALGGACCALATNSNLFALAIWVPFVPSWIIINGIRPWALFVKRIAWFLVGFFAAYCGLTIYLNHVCPGIGPFIERFSISLAQDLLNGGSRPWYEPVGQYFLTEGNYFIIVPLVVGVGAAILVLRSRHRLANEVRERLTAAFTLYLVIIILIYAVNQELFHSPRITAPEYFSYSVIPCALALMAMIGQFSEANSTVTRFAIAAAFFVIPLLWLRLQATGTYNSLPYALFILPLALFIAGVMSRERYRAMACVCVLVFSLAISPFFLRTAGDYGCLLADIPYEWDVYAGAINLVSVVERASPPDLGAIRFWYATDQPGGHWLLSSIASTYLGANRLSGSYPPKVNEDLEKHIDPLATVVVLGMSDSEVRSDVAALTRAGVRAHSVAEATYVGRSWGYAYAILRIEHPRK